MKKTLHLIVFSPSHLKVISRAIKHQIEEAARNGPQDISVTSWDEHGRFFDDANAYPLNECIRKLHSYDGAIVVLGPTAQSATPQPVNSNVLIEIGACMARYGRQRVFLLKPRSDTVDIPSYFRSNNVHFATYDDTVEQGPAAIAAAAAFIVRHLADLGQSAYYSDLPAFGLAHGYFKNFVLPAIQSVQDGATVYAKHDGKFLKGRRKLNFSSAVLIAAVAEDRIRNSGELKRHLASIDLVEAVIEAKGRRDITIFTIPEFRTKKALYIVDVPTTLDASHDAIEKIETLWIDNPGQASEYRQVLERREIANFFRYLEIMSEEADLPGAIRQLPVPTIDRLTLNAILDLTETHG
jgi:hypothetical protein